MFFYDLDFLKSIITDVKIKQKQPSPLFPENQPVFTKKEATVSLSAKLLVLFFTGPKIEAGMSVLQGYWHYLSSEQ